MIVVGGLIWLMDFGLLIIEWKFVIGVVLLMLVEVWEVEFDKYCEIFEY